MHPFWQREKQHTRCEPLLSEIILQVRLGSFNRNVMEYMHNTQNRSEMWIVAKSAQSNFAISIISPQKECYCDLWG